MPFLKRAGGSSRSIKIRHEIRLLNYVSTFVLKIARSLNRVIFKLQNIFSVHKARHYVFIWRQTLYNDTNVHLNVNM